MQRGTLSRQLCGEGVLREISAAGQVGSDAQRKTLQAQEDSHEATYRQVRFERVTSYILVVPTGAYWGRALQRQLQYK
jgi:hypothetical protein